MRLLLDTNVFLEILLEQDQAAEASASLLSLGVADMDSIVAAAQRFNLDFDDAYQYVAAEKNDLTLVSLDGDFDRTERGRQTLAQIVGGAT